MHEPSLFTRQGDDGTFVPFTDILFNALLGFSMMVFIAFSLIKPDAEANAVNIKAEFIITATWPDYNPDESTSTSRIRSAKSSDTTRCRKVL